MRIIKINIAFLVTLLSVLFIGCEVDYKDIDTLGKADSGASEVSINLDLFVAGSWTPEQVVATAGELKVEKYDLFIFKVSSDGNYLEYKEMNIAPDASEMVSHNQSIKIGNRNIILPTGGTKRVVVIANANDRASYPVLCSLAESTKSDFSDVTVYDKFINDFSIKADKQQTSPFVMMGNALVANADMENVGITLAPQYAKINIKNKAAGSETNGLFISSVQLKNVPESAHPFINDYSKKTSRFVNYEVNVVNNGALEEMIPDKLYLLYTPGTSSASADYRVIVLIKGKKNGIDFEKEFPCSNPMYPGYLFNMILSLSGNEVEAEFVPNWSDGDFSISSVHLKNNKMTFPFTADKFWGYEIFWATNMAGAVSVEKQGNESWYSITVEENLVRVCCLEDNTTGRERTASFTIGLGKKKETVEIVQQSMPSTITFNGMEWLDRNLGAILPLTEENITHSDTYGYYYQWGRNVPFPTFGTVGIAVSDPGITIQQAHGMKEFIVSSSSSTDWYTAVSVADKTTTWEDRTGSLGNPCPEGYHVPSYREYQTILPYKNSAGIGNFSNVDFKINSAEILDDTGTLYDALYVTSAKDEATIYAIKKYKTDGAYYLRLRRIKTDSGIYLRIDRLSGNAQSDFVGESADAKLSSASAIFNSATTGMETIYFPAAGRRNNKTGELVNQGINLYSWAATCWDVSSSGIYFDPLDGNTRIYCIAQARSFAQTVRCIKNY